MCMGGCGGNAPKNSGGRGAGPSSKKLNWGGTPKGGSKTKGGSATPRTVSGGAGRFGRPSVSVSFGKKKY